MWELTSGVAQQRAKEVHLHCQLGQAEGHSFVVQDGLVKHFSLASVVSSFLYSSFQQHQDLKKQSTEQDIILARFVVFLVEKRCGFFTWYKQYIRFSKVSYSICSVWGAEFQLWKKSGISLYLEDLFMPVSPEPQITKTQRSVKRDGKEGRKVIETSMY